MEQAREKDGVLLTCFFHNAKFNPGVRRDAHKAQENNNKNNNNKQGLGNCLKRYYLMSEKQ